MRLIKLDNNAFETVLKKTRIQELGEKVLRDLYVNGKGRPEVAKEYGLTKQRVNGYAVRFEKEFLEGGYRFISPLAFVQAELSLPLAVIHELSDLSDVLSTIDDVTPYMDDITKLIKSVAALSRAVESKAEGMQ